MHVCVARRRPTAVTTPSFAYTTQMKQRRQSQMQCQHAREHSNGKLLMRRCTEVQSELATQHRTVLRPQGSSSAAMVMAAMSTANNQHHDLQKQSLRRRSRQPERRLRVRVTAMAQATHRKQSVLRRQLPLRQAIVGVLDGNRTMTAKFGLRIPFPSPTRT